MCPYKRRKVDRRPDVGTKLILDSAVAPPARFSRANKKDNTSFVVQPVKHLWLCSGGIFTFLNVFAIGHYIHPFLKKEHQYIPANVEYVINMCLLMHREKSKNKTVEWLILLLKNPLDGHNCPECSVQCRQNNMTKLKTKCLCRFSVIQKKNQMCARLPLKWHTGICLPSSPSMHSVSPSW